MTAVEQLWFTAPFELELRKTEMPIPSLGQVLVKTKFSAVSPGTEMLLYRGQIPSSMSLDTTIAGMQEQCAYPLQYGYASVGKIIEIGSGVAESWLGKQVFAFQPHASHFISYVDKLIEVPPDIPAERAVFFANMETAVNLVHDGAPLVGERIAVLGLGVIGLLLTSVLTRFPLKEITTFDRIGARREWSLKLGANSSFDPQSIRDREKADLIFEVSGSPEALNLAIELSGFTSRIVVGSWYGKKSAPVWLGGDAHRNRLRVITSQVSTIAPELAGRWSKERRYQTTWDMLRHITPEQWITHKELLKNAAALYAQIDRQPEDCLQPVFTY
jgi:2-desacetyl-2-hydroxyethyl bacteriochlorophyllide A dehydrogenase